MLLTGGAMLGFHPSLFASLSILMNASNWEGWRGPGGRGVSDETGFAEEWSAEKKAEKNIAWKTPIRGRGLSSPIVWGKRVFITTAVEGEKVPGAKPPKHQLGGEDFVHPDSTGGDRSHELFVLGIDLESGKVLWESRVHEGTVHDDRHRRASYASPTSVADGERVFSFFGQEGVACHDFDGKLLWKADVGKYGTIGLGVGSSPVLFDDVLVIQRDGSAPKESFLVALTARTGKEAWRVERDVSVSWSTPILFRGAGRPEVVTCAMERTLAYDPRTGKELWRARGVEANAIHTPLAGEDFIVLSAGYPTKRVLALKAGEIKEGEDRLLWEYGRGAAYVISPILYRGHVYLPSDGGSLTCFEARTGKIVYEGKRLPSPNRCTASPVAFDGKILITGEDGVTFVIAAGPEHRVLATNPIGEPVHASLALSQGRILIRGERHLFCVRKAG